MKQIALIKSIRHHQIKANRYRVLTNQISLMSMNMKNKYNPIKTKMMLLSSNKQMINWVFYDCRFWIWTKWKANLAVWRSGTCFPRSRVQIQLGAGLLKIYSSLKCVTNRVLHLPCKSLQLAVKKLHMNTMGEVVSYATWSLRSTFSRWLTWMES